MKAVVPPGKGMAIIPRSWRTSDSPRAWRVKTVHVLQTLSLCLATFLGSGSRQGS